jgi:hypothetical protein
LQRRRGGHGNGSGGDLIRALVRLFVLFAAVVPLWAGTPLRICIYAGNRGSNRVHRALLKQAKATTPRLFLIDGDLVKYDYGERGTPEAMLEDYRIVLGSARNPLDEWPMTPGPVLIPVPGGMDEEYFVDPGLAEQADRARGRRSIFAGTPELGMQIYDAIYLDQMRIRVQPLPEMGKALPMSPYGDYLLIVGAGPRRELAVLGIYRTDRWRFRPEQIDWIDSTLAVFRAQSPGLPLIAAASDWTWLYPDTLDDGYRDGHLHAVREGTAQSDRVEKTRLLGLLQTYGADMAVAAGNHAYQADTAGTLLRINCGSAIGKDPYGERIGIDNLWLDYSQTADSLFVNAHSVATPSSPGIDPARAAQGIFFVKSRAAGSLWRSAKP